MALELKYRVLDQEVSKEDVEKILAPRSRRCNDGPFDVFVKLPIQLEATAIRVDSERFHGLAKLKNGDRIVILTRDMDGREGDIGFSCSPYGGDEVPINALNIKFRDYHDEYTDRGIVWVFQGDPSTAHLRLKKEAAAVPGRVAEILTQAEEALEQKLLRHFKKQ